MAIAFLAGSEWASAQQSSAASTVDAPWTYQDLFKGPGATGDWLGQRDGLEEKGIEIYADYTVEIWGNVAGGQKKGAVYTGLLNFGVTLDLEKLAGWQGGAFHNSWEWLSGRDPSEQLVGDDLFGASNISGFSTFRLFELWFQQAFLDNAISIRIGQLSADEEFLSSDYAGLFINGEFGFPGAVGSNLPDGGPRSPMATLGVRLEWNPEVARPNGARKIVSFLEVSGVRKDQRREAEEKKSQQRVQSTDSP